MWVQAPAHERSGCIWGIGRLVPPKWWDPMISRVIAVAACGLSLAACSSWMSSLPSMPSMSALKPSPTSEALRIESEPPGAEAKTSQGQSCRTPCEVAVQTGNEISVTLALNGYQPQTVSVRPEAPPPVERDSAPMPGSLLSPNPIYIELQPAPVAPPAAKKPAVKKRKPAVAAAKPAAPAPTTTASVPSAAPAPMPAAPPEPAASATNYPWPTR